MVAAPEEVAEFFCFSQFLIFIVVVSVLFEFGECECEFAEMGDGGYKYERAEGEIVGQVDTWDNMIGFSGSGLMGKGLNPRHVV